VLEHAKTLARAQGIRAGVAWKTISMRRKAASAA